MSTHKGKDDSGPSGYKNLPKATGEEDDVEGHARRMPRDAEPEGAKRLPKFDGSDDDVEGHKK
jgi:hypothetical protein